MIHFISTEYYSPLIKVISSRKMQVLSRLTYGAYLIGEIIHIFHTGRVRTARVASFVDIVRIRESIETVIALVE